MIYPVDETDIKILELLQEDSKITIKQMAERLHLSTTPIFDRIKKMERAQVIRRYVALLDPKRLGMNLLALVDITIKDHSREGIESFVSYIIQFEEVIECHHVTGDSDIYLKILLKDMEAYNEFVLEKISVAPNVGHVMSRFSLSNRKTTTSLPLGHGSSGHTL